MAGNRQHPVLSASESGFLVGATGSRSTHGRLAKTKPKPACLAAIASFRGIGEREVEAKLAELEGGEDLTVRRPRSDRYVALLLLLFRGVRTTR
jgi:hypothetical protein